MTRQFPSILSAACLALVLNTVLGAQTKPNHCAALIPGTPLEGSNPTAPRIVDLGNAKTVRIQILGHSENRGYHNYLQSMLDQAPPVRGIKFVVHNNWIGGHEAFRWAAAGQRGYRTIDTILSANTHPMIVLCLFSNNVSFPIAKPDTSDANFARLTRNLESIADHLYNGGKGALVAYFSSHRYKQRNFLPSFYERAATTWVIQQAAKKSKIYIKAGPEQHDLHWCCFPSCYAPDLAHTNSQGDMLMAQAWYNLLVRELTGSYSEPYGAGAQGAGGHVPVLGPNGGFPKIGNTGFGLRTSRALGGGLVVHLIGVARAAGPLLVSPLVQVPARTGGSGPGNGTHTLALPIPTSVSLHGATVHAQAGVRDSVGAFYGFSLTQGLTFVVGR